MTQRAVLVSLFLLYWPAYGQENKEDLNESARFHSYSSWALPNVELPAHVIAPMGQVTLFADFANASEKGVPLYLVNRSSERLTLNSQDGDIYLKLEFLREDATWQRAQGHIGSGCAHSFGARHLDPGQHMKMSGYHPATGIPAKIRYACYGTEVLISNAAQGFYQPEDIAFSQNDTLTNSLTPSALNQHLGLGDVDPRYISWTDRIAALRLVQVLGGRSGLKAEVEKWRDELSAKDTLTTVESEALAALPVLLAGTWPDVTDPEKLLRHCIELLVSPPKDKTVFGSPENVPSLLWEVLWELMMEPMLGPMLEYPPRKRIPVEAWQPVIKLAAQRLLTLDDRSREMAMKVLKYDRLADEFLTDAEWEPLLLSGVERIVELAATSISRRTRWDRLVELGSKLSAEDQVTVLYALAKGQESKVNTFMDIHGGLRYPEMASPEGKFWQNCMKTSPSRVAGAWHRLSSEMNTVPPYAEELNQYLLDDWKSKISSWDQRKEDFELKSEGDELDDTLDFVMPRINFNGSSSYRYAEDEYASRGQWIVLLQQLVTNRGYQVSGSDPFGAKNQNSREYILRKLAIKALKSLGQPVPENIILEVKAEAPESPAVEAAKPE
ncbi:hypothetical protein WJU23_01850 [Prosthecobacter sp. SYSU 5D2]|uniref:hypothetical protein n=1 Tax=Prosthecobacter sp. SYSU 5D2 TaxID=3134134 RepID=UPI0031FECF61